jgi:hypothetical protein
MSTTNRVAGSTNQPMVMRSAKPIAVGSLSAFVALGSLVTLLVGHIGGWKWARATQHWLIPALTISGTAGTLITFALCGTQLKRTRAALAQACIPAPAPAAVAAPAQTGPTQEELTAVITARDTAVRERDAALFQISLQPFISRWPACPIQIGQPVQEQRDAVMAARNTQTLQGDTLNAVRDLEGMLRDRVHALSQ